MSWFAALIERLFGRPPVKPAPPPRPVGVDHFPDALDFTLGGNVEGGYSDHPADRGGATMAGVTQATYDSWRVRHNKMRRPVRQSTLEERIAIAREYWDLSHAETLPRRLAIAHFDAGFHHGPSRAIRMLQQALGVPVDGRWGLATANAVAQIDDEVAVVRRLLDVRRAFFTSIIMVDPSQAVFHAGWLNRIELLRAELGV